MFSEQSKKCFNSSPLSPLVHVPLGLEICEIVSQSSLFLSSILTHATDQSIPLGLTRIQAKKPKRSAKGRRRGWTLIEVEGTTVLLTPSEWTEQKLNTRYSGLPKCITCSTRNWRILGTRNRNGLRWQFWYADPDFIQMLHFAQGMRRLGRWNRIVQWSNAASSLLPKWHCCLLVYSQGEEEEDEENLMNNSIYGERKYFSVSTPGIQFCDCK